MASDPDDRLARLGVEKALAIGTYGEAVAAYRYLVLAEKAPDARVRPTFAEMADEEQGHRKRLRALSRELFPASDFCLNAEDKAMVVVGPRLLDVKDGASYEQAMQVVLSTEKRTAAFYARMAKQLAASPYSTAELEEIYAHEVAPAFTGVVVAGAFSGGMAVTAFDYPAEEIERLLERRLHTGKIARLNPYRVVAARWGPGWARRDWDRVLHHVERLRERRA